MSDLPRFVTLNEEGPREGFQIEPGPIGTDAKIKFIEGLAETGVRKIDCVSYVNPRKVPGMADATEVMSGVRLRDGVRYTALFLNLRGLERALKLPGDVVGTIRLTASETFSRRNTAMGHADAVREQRRYLARYAEEGIPLEAGYVMTSFGCNFEGEIPVDDVVAMVRTILELAEEFDAGMPRVYLADTVGHASPAAIERVIGRVRDEWPDLQLGLHLHDTRGLGVANAWAAMRLGVDHFDSTCAGLGGCPFAGHAGAAGNVCTEELVFLCEEAGIETDIDLDAMIECARFAESIVGHPLPGKLTRGGSLQGQRSRAAAGTQFVGRRTAVRSEPLDEMLKIIALIRRRSDLSPEAFDRHWRESHPQYVTALPGVVRYVQSPALSHKRPWPYDGLSELWFESLRDIAIAFDSLEAGPMREDETRFIDTIDWFIVDEAGIREIALPGPAGSSSGPTGL